MSPQKTSLLQKPVLAWALYDWANSAFATTVIAGLFPAFYDAITAHLGEGEAYSWFNLTLAATSALVAVAAPLLGIVADYGGARKKFLAGFTMLGVLMTASLAWVHAGIWWAGLLLYAAGTVGFSGANIFYDAMLLSVARGDDAKQYDRISAFGYSLGYLGGGLLFTVNVLMVQFPAAFGLPDAGAAVAVSFVSVGVWWAVFSVPLLLWVKEEQPRVFSPLDKNGPGVAPPLDKGGAGGISSLNQEAAGTLKRGLLARGLADLMQTFRQARAIKPLFLLLIAYWFYIDGVNTIFKTAVFFGQHVLGLPQSGLITALLLTQFVSFPAALFFGWLGARIGAKCGILIGIVVYIGVVLYAWRWLEDAGDFYALAVTVGLVQGGVQALSRSMYARFIPHKTQTAEFFGLFNMVGKFAAIVGPLLLLLPPLLGASQRDSILALLLLFVAGGVLLWRVETPTS